MGLAACERSGRVTSTSQATLPAIRTFGAAAAGTGASTIALPGVAGEPDIRVRLRRGATNIELGATGADALRVLMPGEADTGGLLVAVPARVRVRPGGWEIAGATAAPVAIPSGSVRVEPVRFAPAVSAGVSAARERVGSVFASGRSSPPGATVASREARVIIDGRSYAGELTLALGPGGVDIVETVPIERYLPGVVSGEMYGHWPASALAAQAIAARSYALSERARARAAGMPFDVEAGQSDQAYVGAVDSGPARVAAENTRGVVLTWGGQVLRAYYSSTSGGRTAGAMETFGGSLNAAPPLQNSADDGLGSASPWHRWTVTRSAGELTARLRAWGHWAGHPVKNIRGLGSITASQRNAAGRPVRYTVREPDTLLGAGAEFTLQAEHLRVALNYRTPGQTDVSGKTLVRSGDLEADIVGDTVTIRGRGFGHGVGMCQWSAKELGERGDDFRSILSRFYPGAGIARAW